MEDGEAERRGSPDTPVPQERTGKWVWRSRDGGIMRIHHCGKEVLYQKLTHT